MKCGFWGCGKDVRNPTPFVFQWNDKRVVTTICDYHRTMIEGAEERVAQERLSV